MIKIGVDLVLRPSLAGGEGSGNKTGLGFHLTIMPPPLAT